MDAEQIKKFLYDTYKRQVHKVSDFNKPEIQGAKFMVMIDDSYTSMGHNYGPPDPPPSMETHEIIKCIMLHSEEEVVAWVKEQTNDNSWKKKAYKIFKVDPVNINTSISVSLG